MGNVNTIRVCIQIHFIFHLTKQHKIGYYNFILPECAGCYDIIFTVLQTLHKVCHMPHATSK